MRTQIYIALAASLLAACGENGLMNSTAAPSQVAPLQASADEKLSARYVQGPNSCPDGELVSGITVNTNAKTQAYVTWNDVGSIHEYIVRITRYQGGELVLQHSVKNRTFDKVSLAGSTYVVYIGYQNDCGGFGPFGTGVVFSLDTPDNTPPAAIDGPNNTPPPPVGGPNNPPPPPIDGPNNPPPPVIEDGGHHDPPPPPWGDGDDHGDNHGGGPQGGNACHLNPTNNGQGNDRGGNDHNGDGHPDCGHGNDNNNGHGHGH